MLFQARSLVFLGLALLTACSSSPAATGSGSSSSSGAGGAGGMPPVIGGDRPVTVEVPSTIKAGEKAPLVILLHGYSVNGVVEELYMQLRPLSEERGFFYAHPDGTIEKVAGNDEYFWNATDGCCNFTGSTVDDSAYLSSVIDQIVAAYPVDPKRVFLVGHSNGGFMSYRMACDHAGQIAAIASLAGEMWGDVTRCQPSGPVSVLQIQGTADAVVPYDGSPPATGTPDGIPGAETTVKDWATINGCSPTPDTSAPPLDLDDVLAGAETTVERYTGCKPGGAAELWSIQGGSHLPSLTKDYHEKLIDWLYAHPKP
jgi:polyhydroxybutyrate depolymerase